MNPFTSLVKRHPLILFFVLAFALFWAPLPLASITPVLPVLIGVFTPALSALIVTAIIGGKAGVKALMGKLGIWRINPLWVAAMAGMPFLVGWVAIGGSVLFGIPSADQTGAFAPFSLVLGLLIFGEELGWRGYAFPQLQARFGALGASLLFGAIHSLWHLPYLILIPGQDLYGAPVLAHMLIAISNAVVLTWILNHARGSVLVATLYHAIYNGTGFLYTGISVGTSLAGYWWIRAAAYAVVALVIVMLFGPNLARRPGLPIQAVTIQGSPGE